MIKAGDFDSACRLSGEALAISDSALHQSSDKAAIDNFIGMAVLHNAALQRAGMANEAVGCALMAFCTADIKGATAQKTFHPDLMDLTAFMLSGMFASVGTTNHNDEATQYIIPMIVLTAKLLYHYYNSTLDQGVTSGHSFTVANKLLNTTSQISVRHDITEIDGKPIDFDHPKEIIAEIIGCASALGLLQV